LHDFDLQGSDGGLLYGRVVLDAGGNVFGVTGAGPYPSPDDGVLFENYAVVAPRRDRSGRML